MEGSFRFFLFLERLTLTNSNLYDTASSIDIDRFGFEQ